MRMRKAQVYISVELGRLIDSHPLRESCGSDSAFIKEILWAALRGTAGVTISDTFKQILDGNAKQLYNSLLAAGYTAVDAQRMTKEYRQEEIQRYLDDRSAA